MTGLLTAAAIITTIVLLVSAASTGAKATAGDPNARGTWGIASWSSNRNRPLDPHERRWQTAILSGKDNRSRWKDLVTEIETLEYLGGVEAIGPSPDGYDSTWIESSLANLETAMDTRTADPTIDNPAGDQSR